MKEHNIGDKVWWATCGTREVEVPCPVCFGNRKVTLILGNGEHIETGCEYCEKDFESSRGYTTEYQRFSEVKEVSITGKEVREDEGGRMVEYRYLNYCLDDRNAFSTREDAETAVKAMISEYEDSEVKRQAYKKKKNQSHYSWSVGYHRKRLKDAQREVEYHSRKINESKAD